MNDKEFRFELTKLLNTAAKSNDAGTLVDGLISALASVVALAVVQTSVKAEDAVEATRHQLDIEFTSYYKVYKDAISKTS